jgi:hypothetical protein
MAEILHWNSPNSPRFDFSLDEQTQSSPLETLFIVAEEIVSDVEID